MMLSLALLLGAMSRLSTSDAAAPKSLNSSVPQRTYLGLGCNESNFYGEDITSSFVVMEENVFCEGDLFPGVSEASYGKFFTTCNDAEKTVMFEWYQCNSTDCSVCDETTTSATWVTSIPDWDEPTEETCFDIEILPPYNPAFNFTAMSYRFADDPSPYTQILVENSCISTAMGGGSMGNSTPSSQPTSAGDWFALNMCWFYVVACVGFSVLFG
mmetsp:Transcript_21169/g.34672  ORF Transcript_21169/g.34672 Transcript_21169/m.34672 type:complete len:214 (+) Transcript_21169:92-733(+)